MFTKYKGINIPENYSGNRFKTPLETETKMHKPVSTYTGTRTSISPTFEEAMRQSRTPRLVIDDEADNEPNMSSEELEYESLQDEQESNSDLEGDTEEERIVYPEEELKEPLCDNTYNENTTSEKIASGNGGVLGELGSLIGKITNGLKNEDLLILAIIVLLISENNDDNMIILPLLGLLLYS